MKSSLRSLLFAVLVVPAAACGGHSDSTPSSSYDGGMPTLPKLSPKAEITKPVAIEEQPQPVVAKGDEPAPIPAKFGDAMALGKALVAKGDHSRAKEVFEAAAKIEKKNAEPHIELARMYIGMGERGLAIKSANKAVKLAPESSQAYNTLGRAELLRFNYDNAIEAFRQATELNPENAWAWNNLGYSHLQLKHYKEAVDALETATLKKDAAGYMFNNLGTAYEQMDQLDDAREAFEAGGKLGSKEATASRKRLEGVDSIASLKTAKAETTIEGKTYENAEPMPEDVVDPVVEAAEPTKVETPAAEPTKVEAPAVEKPKVEAPKVEPPKVEPPKVEAPAATATPAQI